MIGYLEGELVAVLDGSVLLRTSGGVGYQVFLPMARLSARVDTGAQAQYFVVTVVREAEISLYGFEDLSGKLLFESLITVSGIGPKAAMAMLSVFSPREVAEAIVSEDVALLSTVPGIGKKTATRLCVELSDRLAADSMPRQTAPGSRGELISALTNLGFPEKDVFTILHKIPADLPSFSDQLKQALALLGKNQHLR